MSRDDTHSKFKSIFKYFSIILLIVIFPKLTFHPFPIDQENKLKIEMSYPFQNQIFLDEQIVKPLENKILNLDFIESLETQIQYGYFKIYVKINSKSSIKDSIFRLRRILDDLRTTLPRNVEKLNLSKVDHSLDADLIFAIEKKDTSKEIILQFLKNEMASLSKSIEVQKFIIFGQDKKEIKLKYNSEKLYLQGNNEQKVLNGFLEYFENFKIENLSDLSNIIPKSISYQKKYSLPGSEEIQILSSVHDENVVHRINSKSLAGIAIYSKNILYSIYNLNYIYNHISDKGYTPIILYNSIPDTLEIWIINSKILFILLNIFIYTCIIKNGSSSEIFILLKNIVKSIPFICVIIFFIDKNIDISIIYTYAIFIFISIADNIYKNKSSLILKSIILNILFYLITLESPINDRSIFMKSFILLFFLSIYFKIIDSNLEEINSKSFILRFISLKLTLFYIFPLKLIRYLYEKLNRKSDYIKKIQNRLVSSKPYYYISKLPFNFSYFKNKNIYILIIFIIIYYFKLLDNYFTPIGKEGICNAFLEMPSGSTLSTTKKISENIEKILIQSGEIERVYAKISDETVKYILLKKSNLPFNSNLYKNLVRSSIPGFFYFPSEIEASKEFISVNLKSDTIQNLLDYLNSFEKEISSRYPKAKILYKFKPPHKLIELEPMYDKLALTGNTISSLSSISALSQNGGVVSRYLEGENLVDIKLENSKISLNRESFFSKKIFNNKNTNDLDTFFEKKEKTELSVIRKMNRMYVLSLLVEGVKEEDLEYLNENPSSSISGSFEIIGEKKSSVVWPIFLVLFFFLTILEFGIV